MNNTFKKVKVLTTVFLGSFLLAYSCETNINDTIDTARFDLVDNLTIDNGQNSFTQVFQGFGATEISLTSNNSITDITIVIPNTDFVDVEMVSEVGLDLYIENEVLHFKDNTDYGATLIDGEPYLFSPNYEGSMNEMEESDFDGYAALLLFSLKEITADPVERNQVNSGSVKKSSFSCGAFNVYYLSSIAWGRSVAEADLDSDAAAELVEAHENDNGVTCQKIGGADSSCLLGDHACYASQAYCCQ